MQLPLDLHQVHIALPRACPPAERAASPDGLACRLRRGCARNERWTPDGWQPRLSRGKPSRSTPARGSRSGTGRRSPRKTGRSVRREERSGPSAIADGQELDGHHRIRETARVRSLRGLYREDPGGIPGPHILSSAIPIYPDRATVATSWTHPLDPGTDAGAANGTPRGRWRHAGEGLAYPSDPLIFAQTV